MFSVLISIYYKENPVHFNECMQSVWDKQTLKPNEIILIKDGPLSADLDQVIDFWQNKINETIKVIELEKNVGTGKAKNIGLQQCSNEIVCIVDTDDISAPDRFEKQVSYLYENPSLTLVGGQIIEFIDTIENQQGMRKVPLTHDKLIDYALKQSPFNNMTIAYRKSKVIEVGGYQHHLWMEDYNLFLRLIAANCRLANLSDTLVYARIGNGMHARRKGLEYIKSEKQLLNLKNNLSCRIQFMLICYF